MAALTPHVVLQRIIDCAYEDVDHTGDLALNRVGVVIGEIADDDCQCGQLVISEQRRYPSRDFPVEEVDHQAECGEPWLVVDALLSLTRCVPGPDGSGNPPSVADLSAAASQLSTDMGRVRRAVLCCLTALYDLHDQGVEAFELGAQDVTGPLGGCAGFTLRVLIGYTNDCGCD